MLVSAEVRLAELVLKNFVVRMTGLIWPSLEQCSEAIPRIFSLRVQNMPRSYSIRTTSSSPSVSRVDGSGIGPSITHLLDSYFVLIKFSIFLSMILDSHAQDDVLWPCSRFRGYMAWRQFCFPISACISIALTSNPRP